MYISHSSHYFFTASFTGGSISAMWPKQANLRPWRHHLPTNMPGDFDKEYINYCRSCLCPAFGLFTLQAFCNQSSPGRRRSLQSVYCRYVKSVEGGWGRCLTGGYTTSCSISTSGTGGFARDPFFIFQALSPWQSYFSSRIPLSILPYFLIVLSHTTAIQRKPGRSFKLCIMETFRKPFSPVLLFLSQFNMVTGNM